MKEQVLKQIHTVNSPLNKKVFLSQIDTVLSSLIFNELINNECKEIVVTVTMDVVE